MVDLRRWLAVDDTRLSIGQESFGQANLMGAGRAGRGHVGQPMHDQHVHRPRRPRQLEALLHPGGEVQGRLIETTIIWLETDSDVPNGSASSPRCSALPTGGAAPPLTVAGGAIAGRRREAR